MSEFDLLQCGLSKHFHFVQNPKQLSCGHSFCKDCLKTSNAVGMKCEICGKLNEIDSSKLDESPIVKRFIKIQIDDICKAAENEFEKCIKKIKESISIINSETDTQIKYAKDEIEIRVESLKSELDLLNDKLQARLDNLKIQLSKWVFFCSIL
jgi:hypothetical protein